MVQQGGDWVSFSPVPVTGEWKTLLRLHDGRTLAAAPVYMAADPGIGAAELAAVGRPAEADRRERAAAAGAQARRADLAVGCLLRRRADLHAAADRCARLGRRPGEPRTSRHAVAARGRLSAAHDLRGAHRRPAGRRGRHDRAQRACLRRPWAAATTAAGGSHRLLRRPSTSVGCGSSGRCSPTATRCRRCRAHWRARCRSAGDTTLALHQTLLSPFQPEQPEETTAAALAARAGSPVDPGLLDVLADMGVIELLEEDRVRVLDPALVAAGLQVMKLGIAPA